MFRSISLSAILLAASTVMASSAGFAVVDINKVVESSPQMMSKRAALEKEAQEKSKVFQDKAKAFNAEVVKFGKERSVMAKAEIKKKEDEFQKRQQALVQEEQSLQQAFSQKHQVMMEEIINEVKRAAEVVAKDKGYSTVIQKSAVVVIDQNHDLTAEVQKQLSK